MEDKIFWDLPVVFFSVVVVVDRRLVLVLCLELQQKCMLPDDILSVFSYSVNENAQNKAKGTHVLVSFYDFRRDTNSDTGIYTSKLRRTRTHFENLKLHSGWLRLRVAKLQYNTSTGNLYSLFFPPY